MEERYAQYLENHYTTLMKHIDIQWKAAIISFLIISALMMPLHSYAQISATLLAFLPDSCKPKPANKISPDIAEMRKIFQYAEGYVTPQVSAELDSLATVLAQKALAEKNDSLCMDVLSQLTQYSMTANNFGAALNYCTDLLKIIPREKKYNTFRYSSQKLMGAIYAASGRFEESIRYFNTCLTEAKAERDSIGIAEIYSGISYPYAILGLYELCIASLDSSIAYFGNLQEGQLYYPEQEDVRVSRCSKYLNLYETTGNSQYGQKAEALINTAKTKKNHHYLYDIFPVVKAYLDGNYQRALFMGDSLLQQMQLNNPPHKNEMVRYINERRAMIFLVTGRGTEGAAILQQLIALYLQKRRPGRSPNLNIIRISEKLYNYYKAKEQSGQALTYLEINKAYNDSLNLLENRGHIFEFEQKYNFSQKEAQLRVLERNNIIRSKERNQAVFAGVISFLCMIVVFILLYNRNRKLDLKRKFAEQEAAMKIDRLQVFSQLQIAELEERSNTAQQEERKKMGMELHDDVAASLASINIKLGANISRISDKKLQNDFEELRLLVGETYESVREKSHHWYNNTNTVTDSSYAKKINDLLQTALPANSYQKEVMIDDECMHKVSLQTKIELLYIIREAVANILKHANAKKILVLIYSDIPGIIMEINDNGKGFDLSSRAEGIGLKSIKNRATAIGGKADIISGKNGTEIKVTVPSN